MARNLRWWAIVAAGLLLVAGCSGTGGTTGTYRPLDVNTLRVTALPEVDGALAYSPDGTLAAVVRGDGLLCVVPVPGGAQTDGGGAHAERCAKLPVSEASRFGVASFSADGSLAYTNIKPYKDEQADPTLWVLPAGSTAWQAVPNHAEGSCEITAPGGDVPNVKYFEPHWISATLLVAADFDARCIARVVLDGDTLTTTFVTTAARGADDPAPRMFDVFASGTTLTPSPVDPERRRVWTSVNIETGAWTTVTWDVANPAALTEKEREVRDASILAAVSPDGSKAIAIPVSLTTSAGYGVDLTLRPMPYLVDLDTGVGTPVDMPEGLYPVLAAFSPDGSQWMVTAVHVGLDVPPDSGFAVLVSGADGDLHIVADDIPASSMGQARLGRWSAANVVTFDFAMTGTQSHDPLPPLRLSDGTGGD